MRTQAPYDPALGAAAPTGQSTTVGPTGPSEARGLAAAPESLRFLVLLGLPAFALAFSSTVVSSYLPVLIEELSGPGVAGLLLGGEGLFGLVLPMLVGSFSDRTDSRIGARMPYLVVGAMVAGLGLVLMTLVGTLLGFAIALLLFYLGYFSYYTPYLALYPDVVRHGMRGRAVGLQGTWRSLGMSLAMVGGGVMLGLWRPLPFLLAAVAALAITAALLGGVAELSRVRGKSVDRDAGRFAATWRLLRDRSAIRWFLVANSLWELAIAALKTFVVLFFTIGLGRSLEFTSLVLACVALGGLLAAPISGWAADRFGVRRVLRASLWVFALGLFAPFLTVSSVALVAVPVVAFAAVTVATLPYSVLMSLTPADRYGAGAGLFGFSHGLGTLLGPLIAGGAIELSQPVLESTHGYGAVFGVAGLAILASLPALRRTGA